MSTFVDLYSSSEDEGPDSPTPLERGASAPLAVDNTSAATQEQPSDAATTPPSERPTSAPSLARRKSSPNVAAFSSPSSPVEEEEEDGETPVPMRRRRHTKATTAPASSRLSIAEPMQPQRAQERRKSAHTKHARSSSLGLALFDVHGVNVQVFLPNGTNKTIRLDCYRRVSQVKAQVWNTMLKPLIDEHGCGMCPWWHGSISQQDAEAKLTEIGTDGVFLVRLSASSGNLSLAVLWETRVLHIQLTKQNNEVALGQRDDGRERFATVGALIQYYSEAPLRLQAAADATLTTPCCKFSVSAETLDSALTCWFSSPERTESDIMLAFESSQEEDTLQPVFDESVNLFRLPACVDVCAYGNTLALHVVPNHIALSAASDNQLESDITEALGPLYDKLRQGKAEEVQACRSAYACLAHNARMTKTNYESYALAMDVDSSSRLLPPNGEVPLIRLHVTLLLDNAATLKTDEVVSGSGEASVLIERILYTIKAPADNYVLKVPGRFEYISGPHRLVDFKYIRANLLRASRSGIELHLVPKKQAMAHASAPHACRGKLQHLRFSRHLNPYCALATPTHTFMAGSKLSYHFASMWTDNKTSFSLRVLTAALGPALKAAAEKLLFRVSVELCHGSRVLAGPMRTPWCSAEAEEPVVWQTPLNMSVRVCDIPRSASLRVVMEAARRGKRDQRSDEVTEIASVSFNALTEHAELISGKQVFKTAEDSAAPNFVELTLQFDSHPRPMVFPRVLPGDLGDELLRHDKTLVQDIDASPIAEAERKLKSHMNASPEKPHVDNTGDTAGKSIYVPDDLVALVIRLASSRFGIKLADRRAGLKKAKRSFSGKELTEWLRDFDKSLTQDAAFSLACRLMRSRVFRSSSSSGQMFMDSDKDFYHFLPFSFVRPMSGTQAESPHEAQMFQKVARASQKLEDDKRLYFIARSDLLTPLNEEDRRLVFRCRERCTNELALLPKFLMSVDWAHAFQVREAYRLLKTWSTTDSASIENENAGFVGVSGDNTRERVHHARTAAALELLNHNHVDLQVRSHAVSLLEQLGDSEVETFLVQLVQVLQFEPYLNNPLGIFLLQRALRSRRIGFVFHSLLSAKVEGADTPPRLVLQCAVLLEAYLRGCGEGMRFALLVRTRFNALLRSIDRKVGPLSSRISSSELQRLIRESEFPQLCPALCDLSCAVKLPIPEKCKVMDSKQKPLWLIFRNADSVGNDVGLIFKSGDDLRQDMLCLQLLRLFDMLWQREGLDLQLTPYRCVPFGPADGFIEVVPRATTLSDIHAQHGLRGSFKEEVLLEWLQAHNKSPEKLELAKDTFTLSCAGYCVATYVLGVGDRHNGNIMINEDGRFFHIDFGHFLGNVKSKFGVQRERTPFVLTPDMVHVMGGKDGKRFVKFVALCKQAFSVLRRHSRLIIALFAMMLSTGMTELTSADDIHYLRQSLALDTPSHEAGEAFERLIHHCLRKGWTTQLNFLFHNLARDGKKQ